MDDKLKIIELNGRWSVGFNNTEIVAFAGPDARATAERQWAELTQLLSVTAADAEKDLRAVPDDHPAPHSSSGTSWLSQP